VTDWEEQIRDDLEPDADPALLALAARLRDARPLPNPTFRGELGRRLSRRRSPWSRARIRATIAAYSASGTFLLLVGAISASGHGPVG
jgi:hypothetical protein